MMTLTKYYQKSWLRRALCHFFPFCLATILGALAIMVLDRNLPQEVIWGKIIPPVVLPGQPVQFHFGLKKYTEYGGYLKRWVTDVHGQVFPLTDSPTVSDQVKTYGIEKEITKDFTVPCGMGVGEAAYHSTAYLHSWWNIMQRVYPVTHDVEYPFMVATGRYKEACALTVGGDVGRQGAQGIQGIPGEAAPVVLRPRVIHKVWLEPTTMVPGGKFVVHIDATINQICPGETQWSLIRTSDGVEVSKVVQATAPVTLGMNHIAHTRTLPLTVAPGEYYYTASVHEFCGPDRTTFIASSEHVPFTVVAK